MHPASASSRAVPLGYREMLLDGTHLINHVGAPLLSLYSFLCLETEPRQKLPRGTRAAIIAVCVVLAPPAAPSHAA